MFVAAEQSRCYRVVLRRVSKLDILVRFRANMPDNLGQIE